MIEKTTGIYSLLSNPFVYSIGQKISGGTPFWRKIVNKFIFKNGAKVLDIGCGPADLLDSMPEVDYYGYDTNSSYINHAKKRYKNRGKFYCKKFTSKDIKKLPKFDHVLLFGVLHHLSDAEIIKLMSLLKKKLKKTGNIITVEPVYIPNQNPFEKFVIKMDRGSNVKSKKEYVSLMKKYFKKNQVNIYHQIFFPFTWIVINCKN